MLGLSGGIVRDVLVGNLPVMVIRIPWYIVTVAGVTVLVIVASRFIPPLTGMWFVVLDALTLGPYTAIATGYALQAGVPVTGSLFVGAVAGVVVGGGGGMLVALLRGATPAVLLPGVFYAVIALAGACVYAAIQPAIPSVAALTCVALVVLMRTVAVRWGLGTHALPLVKKRRDAEG